MNIHYKAAYSDDLSTLIIIIKQKMKCGTKRGISL